MNEKVVVPLGVGTESAITVNSTQYNEATLQKQLIHEELNSTMNWHGLVERINNKTARDVSFEPKVNKIPAFVIGSGPSLDHSIKFLKDWKGGIFCTTSHALTLMRHGIEPTHIIALDPFSTWEEIEGVDWSKTKTKLIAQPGAWPTLIENWPNEILLFIQTLGNPDSWYLRHQKIMYTHRVDQGKGIRDPLFTFYIPTEITVFACSPPVQMFMADMLGYGNIFLAGVDFAYSEKLDRFTSYTVKKNENDLIEWEEHVHPFVYNDKMIKTKNGLWSDTIHIYYKKNMISAWRLSNQTVYTTDHGSITEIPFMDIEKVLKHQGVGDYFPAQSKQFIAHAAETYLAGVGAFIIETKMGVAFVESMVPWLDLVDHMLKMQNQFYCSNCRVNVVANDFEDHTGETCEQCKNGKLTHAHDINIQENVKRIKFLLQANNIHTTQEQWDTIPNEIARQKVLVKQYAELNKPMPLQQPDGHGE